MQTIDLTPTWGEIGHIYARLAASGETKALASMQSEAARAFAAAQALQAIQSRLPDELLREAYRVIDAEMTKQGFPPKDSAIIDNPRQG